MFIRFAALTSIETSGGEGSTRRSNAFARDIRVKNRRCSQNKRLRYGQLQSVVVFGSRGGSGLEGSAVTFSSSYPLDEGTAISLTPILAIKGYDYLRLKFCLSPIVPKEPSSSCSIPTWSTSTPRLTKLHCRLDLHDTPQETVTYRLPATITVIMAFLALASRLEDRAAPMNPRKMPNTYRARWSSADRYHPVAWDSRAACMEAVRIVSNVRNTGYLLAVVISSSVRKCSRREPHARVRGPSISFSRHTENITRYQLERLCAPFISTYRDVCGKCDPHAYDGVYFRMTAREERPFYLDMDTMELVEGMQWILYVGLMSRLFNRQE